MRQSHMLTVLLAAHVGRRPATPRRQCPCRWEMAYAATDGHGHISCPLCGAPVDVEPLGGRVVRIKAHSLVTTETREAVRHG